MRDQAPAVECGGSADGSGLWFQGFRGFSQAG